MDIAMSKEDNAAIAEILAGFVTAEVHFHALRTRLAGHHRFAEVHVLVPGAWSVQRGHDLMEEVEAAVHERVRRHRPHLPPRAHRGPPRLRRLHRRVPGPDARRHPRRPQGQATHDEPHATSSTPSPIGPLTIVAEDGAVTHLLMDAAKYRPEEPSSLRRGGRPGRRAVRLPPSAQLADVLRRRRAPTSTCRSRRAATTSTSGCGRCCARSPTARPAATATSPCALGDRQPRPGRGHRQRPQPDRRRRARATGSSAPTAPSSAMPGGSTASASSSRSRSRPQTEVGRLF